MISFVAHDIEHACTLRILHKHIILTKIEISLAKPGPMASTPVIVLKCISISLIYDIRFCIRAGQP